LKPWSKNIRSSLRKEPKVFLWDWSLIENQGSRVENFVASHLLKSVHYWTDFGLGKYELFYLRDKQKREVDFLVVKDNLPWFLVEVKTSNNSGISKSLYTFQEQTGAKHAFQVIFDMDYVDKDCFNHHEPVIVPAKTFLSQLI
jgi:predicted AAA+ superfamily ATPase